MGCINVDARNGITLAAATHHQSRPWRADWWHRACLDGAPRHEVHSLPRRALKQGSSARGRPEWRSPFETPEFRPKEPQKAHRSMPHEPQEFSRRSVLCWLSDAVFLPLALLYTFSAAAFGCSGSIETNNINQDPNRALGTFEVPSTFTEPTSAVYFNYWIDGDSGISPDAGRVLEQAIGPIRCRARITIVPGSILYEETATETATGRTMTVSISGIWTYDSFTRLRVNWGTAIVTASTFPSTPTFALASVGTRIQQPQPGDIIFANSSWSRLNNVLPGPVDGVFNRTR